MLAGVVAADDGRGWTARSGDRHGVVNTISYQRSVSRGAGHGAGARAAGEGLGNVELVKIQSQQDNVLVCSAYLVNAL